MGSKTPAELNEAATLHTLPQCPQKWQGARPLIGSVAVAERPWITCRLGNFFSTAARSTASGQVSGTGFKKRLSGLFSRWSGLPHTPIIFSTRA